MCFVSQQESVFVALVRTRSLYHRLSLIISRVYWIPEILTSIARVAIILHLQDEEQKCRQQWRSERVISARVLFYHGTSQFYAGQLSILFPGVLRTIVESS